MYATPKNEDDVYLNNIKNLLESQDFDNVELAFQILKGEAIQKKDKELEWLMTNHPRKVLKCLEYGFSSLVEKSVEYLNLQGLNLAKLPENISVLKNLKHLYLHYNNLRELPESITQLQYLEHITIGANISLNIAHTLKLLNKVISLKELHLLDAGLLYLTDDIGGLKQLEVLDLGQNKLKILPESLVKLQNLKKLKIEQNLFTSIPAVLYEMTFLKTLEIGNNTLPEIEIQKLIQKLSNTLIYL